MTTIKLKTDLKIAGCNGCPFIEYQDILDYGEITGEYNAYCELLEGEYPDMDCKEYDEVHRDEYVREDRRPNCPIISVEITEEGS